MGRAQHLLDQAQSLAAIDALDPAAHASELAAELAPAGTLADLEARDARLAAAVASIEAAITRVMRIRLDHALAADTSIAAPTRRVFAQTISSYAGRLELLEQRARDVAANGGARDPDAIAVLVTDAAAASLALREALHAGVLGLIRGLATASIPDADRCARDRTRSDAERKRWSAARRELEALVADPTRIASAAWAARVQAFPEQLDEPAPEPEPSLADLIELD
jgi:hypothetical protein